MHLARRFWVLIAPPILLCFLGVARAADPPRDLSPVLEPLRQRFALPGLVAAIVDNGRLAAIGAVGVRKIGATAPLSIDDQIHLGSDTKAMTAVLIGQLIDEKKLDLDTTMRAIFGRQMPSMNPQMAQVTVRDLLNHTSGIATHYDPGWLKPADSLSVQRLRVAEQVLSNRPDHRRGNFVYSNTNFVLLGAILENETGKSWEDLVRDRLFVPLGMTSAGFGAPGTPGKTDEPWGHWTMLGIKIPSQQDNPPFMNPAGRVHCTIGDWAKFINLIVSGGTEPRGIITPHTLARMLTPPKGKNYAGGWEIVTRDWAGGRTLTHAGSNGMWYCVAWLAPAKNFAMLVATNEAGDDVPWACDAATAAIYKSYLGK